MTLAKWLPILFPGFIVLASGQSESGVKDIGAVREQRQSANVSPLPVKVRGVVTSIRDSDFPDFVIQDKTGGLVVRLTENVGHRLEPGQEVEVEGEIDTKVPELRLLAGGFAPGPMVGLPQPVEVSGEILNGGVHEFTYSRLSGVIRKVTVEENIAPARLILDIGPTANRASVWISHFDEATTIALKPDTEITATGVIRSWKTKTFQPFSTFLNVTSPEAIQVKQGAPDRIAELPLRTVRQLVSSAYDPLMTHRERIRGVVTLCWRDGHMVLESPDGAILVEVDQPESLPLGTQVEVAGFPSRRGHNVILENSILGERGVVARIIPEDVGPRRLLDEVYDTDRDMRLLRVAGVFRYVIQERDRQVLVIESERMRVQAILPKDEPLPPRLKRGAEVQLDGVCRMLITDRAKRIGQLPDSLELMLHESHSINVTGDGDWWTTTHAA